MLAWWLRNPLLPYAGATPGASDFSNNSSPASPDLRRLTALREMRQQLAVTESHLRQVAGAALSAPVDPERAFDYLRKLPGNRAIGVVVTQDGAPLAWGGQIRTALTADSGTSVITTPFYTSLQVAISHGHRRAVAMSMIHAEPPADRLADAIDQHVAARKMVDLFRFGLPSEGTGELVRSAARAPLLRVDAVPLAPDVLRFRQAAAVRAKGTVVLGLLIMLMLALAWSDRRAAGLRLATLAIALLAIALVPWNNFSDSFRIFDPAFFYLSNAGPFAANAGVLSMFAALLLIAVLAIVRSRRAHLPGWLAIAGSIIAVPLGLVVVAVAANGISVPPGGSTILLWLSWEVPLFLILFAFWLVALWLAMDRGQQGGAPRIRATVLVAIAAGVVAVSAVWRTTTAERLALASRDVASLQQPEGDASFLLSRFAQELAQFPTPGSRADLLKRYVRSDLAAADLQVSLGAWNREGTLESNLDLATLAFDSASLSGTVAAAASSGKPAIRETLGPAGRQLMMAVPHSQWGITSIVVSPRTRLVEQNPYMLLLGFDVPAQAEAPYTLTLADVTQSGQLHPGRLVWRRSGDQWHGDELIATSRGPARAHVEVDLRSEWTRAVRGTLIVILNVAIAGLLWAIGAMAEGGFWRWVRRRSSRWLRSYRGRLSLALSLFFVVPAVTFATWSYKRLQVDDRGVRELLVYETLHRETSASEPRSPDATDDTPLFLYSSGMLSASNDSLYAMLSPGGSALPPAVQVSLMNRGELTAGWQQRIAGTSLFWGYRATTGTDGQRLVLAAPARSDELVLDRRRRDLTILVLFATALGAIAAFWLSGIAARILARDLELSRIEVSRAERVLAWGEMARQVAHEIKNPLTPIRLGVQHLRRARHDPRVDFDRVLDENVTRILSEIDHLDEIARAFSRYGSAPADLPPAEDIDIASILRDVVGLEKIGIGGVQWLLSGADEPTVARARTDELRDVLLNVFENARLARARTVTIKMFHGDRAVMIEVADDGSGIPAAALNRVFEPHFSTRTTGSGLGLAISRRLLESWGGKIEIESQEGHGAKVLITLQASLS